MIPKAAIDLILDAEGLDQPGDWPGQDSGITIGHGYDLGFTTNARFLADWGPYLPAPVMGRLLACCGKRGQAARAIAPHLADIEIPKAAADAVFTAITIPAEEATTAAAFPGYAYLPQLAQGALVSLVYNRGADCDRRKPRRVEMADIHDALAALAEASPDARTPDLLACTLRKIAASIRAMKRLWIGKGVDGLVTRREAEAAMVESAIPSAA